MQYSALVGDVALDFSLPDTEGTVRRLAEFHQLGPATLLFASSAYSWGSRWQFWNYLRHYDAFVRLAAEVVIIGGDEVNELRRLQARLALPFVFLSDPDGRVAERYETGIGAATLVIDRRGIIRFHQNEPWLRRTPAHRVLNVIRQLAA